MKKYIKKVVIYITPAIIIVFGVLNLGLESKMNKSIDPETLVTNDTITLSSIRQILFENFDELDFTCTGMTYDSTNDSIWIADYGATEANEKISPRLIEVNTDYDKVLQIIELEHLVLANSSLNLQGISYDEINDSLWIATGAYVYEISKSGKILSQFSMGKYLQYKSNGIAVEGDNIWVLCYEKYLLKFDKQLNLLEEYEFNYKNQDQICIEGNYIYCTVGADYNGTNNFVFRFDIKTGEIINQYRLLDSYSVEGIVINNGKMYITNDGKYHSDFIECSYICEYILD